MNKKVISWVIIATVIIIATIILAQMAMPKTDPETDQLAKCLAEKDATLYVSEFCGYCQAQKELFGTSFQKLNSINCADQPIICQEAGITGVPTWIINGESYLGVQSLSKLKELTNC